MCESVCFVFFLEMGEWGGGTFVMTLCDRADERLLKLSLPTSAVNFDEF